MTKAATKMTEEELELEFITKMAEAHLEARAIAQEILGVAEPTFDLVNQVFDEVIYLDDDGELVEDSIEEAKVDLGKARAWAKTTYGDDRPAATLAAYKRLFAEEEDEEDVTLADVMDLLVEIKDLVTL